MILEANSLFRAWALRRKANADGYSAWVNQQPKYRLGVPYWTVVIEEPRQRYDQRLYKNRLNRGSKYSAYRQRLSKGR